MNTVAAINPTGAEIHSPETMPHSIEAEQQLLGAILSNNDVFDRADSLISSEHFFDPVHANIYEEASGRIKKNSIASPVTLTTFLKDDPGLNELGGANYLAKLAASAVARFAVQD